MKGALAGLTAAACVLSVLVLAAADNETTRVVHTVLLAVNGTFCGYWFTSAMRERP